MRSTIVVRAARGLLAVAGVALLVRGAVGCGGGSSATTSVDGGTDASSDASPVPPDGTTDGAESDAALHDSAATADTGPGADASSTPDATSSPDATSTADGASDATSSPDGALADAAADAPPEIDAGCASPSVICSGQCTTPATDPLNCGACGNACMSGFACANGTCSLQCPANQTLCSTDAGTSGAGGPAPDASADGGAGALDDGASGGGANDDGAADDGESADATSGDAPSGSGGPEAGVASTLYCADLGTDPNNCGGCGVVCPSLHDTPSCVNGACAVGTCSAGYADCDGNPQNGCETNTGSDPNNCGTCQNACSVANGTPACNGGKCAIASCNPGYADCDMNAANGCETNTGSDSNNCGTCGTVCVSGPNSTSQCSTGTCQLLCTPGYFDCDGNPNDGCEVDGLTDPSNCGGCGDACNLPNATPSCSGGTCGVAACNAGYANCDMNAANGCEVTTGSDPNNCGTCGNACPSGSESTPVCAKGACSITCAAGFLDCDGSPFDGCEVNSATNPSNCGACGHACSVTNGKADCVSGTCGVGACNPGYGDCDHSPSACATNLSSDPNNCGICGTVCPSGPESTAVCSGAECTLDCASGYLNCDSNPANGCEVNDTNDPNDCGSCGTRCAEENGTAVCTGATCGLGPCNPGFANCDGKYSTGCNVNTNLDTNNCGKCGDVCNLPNATPTCTGGQCEVSSCAAGYQDCDHQPADGCEVNTLTSTANCGACGEVCAPPNATPACDNASCAIASCNTNFANCNGLITDGCEVNLQTNVHDCGSCGNACNLANATPTCTAGECAISKCNTGYADCDLNPTDGCEIDTVTDPNNCGSCGHVCSSGKCASSACQ